MLPVTSVTDKKKEPVSAATPTGSDKTQIHNENTIKEIKVNLCLYYSTFHLKKQWKGEIL